MANEISAAETGGSGAGAAVKLLGIFLVSFLVVLAIGWVWDFFSESLMRQQIESAPATGGAVLVVDPKIEQELAKVLNYELTEGSDTGADLRDPFSDRSNLSNAAAVRFSALPTRDQLGAATSGASLTPSGGSGGSSKASSSASAEADKPVKIDIAKETMEGVRRRQERLRAGMDPGPQSAIFFIDDLLPVGMVSGGSKAPEVLMYSISMKRTYSFPAGAVFRDGWLATWRTDGVAFGDATRNGAIFLKPWTSNVSGSGQPEQIVIDSGTGKDSTD